MTALLLACSFVFSMLAAIGFHPVLALVVTVILIAFVASKFRKRGKA